MRIFKYRTFRQWAKKEGISDSALKKAIDEIENGLFNANLGNGLYKQRIAKKAMVSGEVTEQYSHLKKKIDLFLCMVMLKMIALILVTKKKQFIKN